MGLRNRNLFKEKQCFFVTTSCHQGLHLFNSDSRKLIITQSLQFISEKYKIAILGCVIMPNHIHMIFWFKGGNVISDAMRDFKKFTSTVIRKDFEAKDEKELLNRIKVNDKQIFRIWQERFDEVWIEDITLLEVKLNYIHLNPLQGHWNLEIIPENYTFSSAAFYQNGCGIPGLGLEDYRDYF